MAAQFLVTCEYCEHPSECFCNPCQKQLCTNCVSFHIQQKSEDGHEIVCNTKRKKKYTFHKCKNHNGVECQMFCKTCDVPICPKCVAAKHKSHDLIDLEEKIDNVSYCLDKEQNNLKYCIKPLYQKMIEQIKYRITTVRAHFRSLSDTVTQLGAKWHQVVEDVIVDIKNDLMQMEIDQLNLLEKDKLMLQEIVEQLESTIRENSDLGISKNRAKLLHYNSEMKRYSTIPPLKDFTAVEFQPKLPEKDTLKDLFGSVERFRILDLPEYRVPYDVPQKLSKCLLKHPMLISLIETGFGPDDQGNKIYDLVATSHGRFWATGYSRVLKLFDTNGNLIDSVTLSHKSSYISGISDGLLAYSDQSDNTIKRIESDGSARTFVNAGEWVPKGLASFDGRSGPQLFVCLHRKEQHKVVKYNKEGLSEQEFLYPAEHHPLYITINKNGDIGTTDHRQNSVAVLDKFGHPRFMYTGNREVGKMKSFQPISIATDCFSNYLISDWANHVIHLLNGDGVFLRVIALKQSLKEPRGLCIIGEGLLSVGECATGAIKVLRYLKTKSDQ